MKWLLGKFAVEKLMRLGLHRSKSNKSSILHFSFNKAATQTVKKLLTDCGLDALFTATGMQFSRSLCLKFLRKHEMPEPKGENRGKLQAGTFEKLNCIIEVTLNRFNYTM